MPDYTGERGEPGIRELCFARFKYENDSILNPITWDHGFTLADLLARALPTQPARDHGSTLLARILPTQLASGGIVVCPTFKDPTVIIRPPNWTDSTCRIRAENYEAAQYIADAVYYYIGCEPFYFRDASIQYPPLRLGTRALLTREMCSDYVKSLSNKISGTRERKQRDREDYMKRVKDLVLKAVRSPEAVLFLRSLRAVSRSVTNLEATEDGRIAVDGNEAASIEDESHSAGNDDDDPAEHVRGLPYIASFGIDWFDSGTILPSEHKTSSSMEGFLSTLEGFLSTLDIEDVSRGLAASGAHDGTSALPDSFPDLPVIEDADVQSVWTEEVNSEISEDNASRHEYQQNHGDTSQGNGQQCELHTFTEGEVDAVTITERDMELGNDQQLELFTFPEGEVDAVTITERDLESLQITMFLSDNIIDFYIKYLERRLSSEEKISSFFFSSFFFTKLLGNNSASTDIDLCEVDYEQVRKWTREVNLFEKDFIFIFVLRSSHWSLIIISHLGSLTISPDIKKSTPFIFHLDSIKGKHECLERQIRSYLYQACRERYQASNKKDQMLLAVASQMKYVQAKVPQQENGYDCGLYLLQYVEAFLFESPRFSLATSKWGAHFAREVSAKRMAIRKLILERSRTSEERAAKSMDIPNLNQQPRTRVEGKAICGGCIEHVQNYGTTMLDAQGAESKHAVHLSAVEVALGSQQQPTGSGRKRSTTTTPATLSPPRKRNVSRACAASLEPPMEQHNSKKWTDQETSELFSAMVGGRYCRGKRGGMRWDDISIEDAEGRRRSKTQCQNRYDVLLKAYKTIKDHIDKTGKPFSEITEKERRDMKLATPLSEEWYKDLDKIYCQRRPDNAKSQKRAKLNPGVGNGPLSTNHAIQLEQ